jgi:hypothetical protein
LKILCCFFPRAFTQLFVFLSFSCLQVFANLDIQFLAFSDTHVSDVKYENARDKDVYIDAMKQMKSIVHHTWSDGSSVQPDFTVLNGDWSMDQMFETPKHGFLFSSLSSSHPIPVVSFLRSSFNFLCMCDVR